MSGWWWGSARERESVKLSTFNALDIVIKASNLMVGLDLSTSRAWNAMFYLVFSRFSTRLPQHVDKIFVINILWSRVAASKNDFNNSTQIKFVKVEWLEFLSSRKGSMQTKHLLKLNNEFMPFFGNIFHLQTILSNCRQLTACFRQIFSNILIQFVELPSRCVQHKRRLP